MDSNISELVKLGHERADELKAACGAVNVRSMAQLISDLASQLEVQYVRSNALAAELKQNKIDADCYKKGMEASNARLVQLAAENAGLKAAGNKMFLSAISLMEDPELKIDHARDIKDWESIKTPSTDAFLAEMRAQAIESLLTESFRADIAGALADFDGMDEQSLQTLIWSGQPPEPDGDVWCVEYMSRAAAVLRKVREFAAQLRKGEAQ